MNFATTYQESDKESLDDQHQLGLTAAGACSYDVLCQASTNHSPSMLSDPNSDPMNSYSFGLQYQDDVY